MPKIYFFGDSFTDMNVNTVPYRKQYDDYMGYKTIHFSDILSKKLNAEIVNHGIGGVDNDTIFETIIDNINHIEPNDIVCVNWTTISRYRLITSDTEQPTYILPNTVRDLKPAIWNVNSGYLDIDTECLEKMLINRESYIFLNQILKWTKLLKKTFKDNKTLFWSPFMDFKDTEILTTMSPPEDFEIDFKKYKDMGVKFNNSNMIINTQIMLIDGHTNGRVKDLHYSEIGNHLISDLLFHELNKQ